MITLKLPVTSDGARTFTSEIDGVAFRFRTYLNRLDGWYIDIYDNLENAIVQGVALNTGIDILRQFTGNSFGHELEYYTSDGSSGEGVEDLGKIGFPVVKVNA